MADAIAHVFWDSCVFCALLYDQQQAYDVNSIEQYLRDAKNNKCQIFTSSLVFAEIVPSSIKKNGIGSFQQFIDDLQGSVIVIDASPNVMHAAGILRDLPYKKSNSSKRVLATTDAIMLASCLFVKDAMGVAIDHFHTYDDGKKRGREGKMVPLLSYQDWCEGFTADQMKISQPVINLSRQRPIYPRPELFSGRRNPECDDKEQSKLFIKKAREIGVGEKRQPQIDCLTTGKKTPATTSEKSRTKAKDVMLTLSASTWTVLGVVLGVVGVLILFRYGMPFRVRSEGFDTVVVSSANPRERDLDKRYTLLGYLGLVFVIAGALCDMGSLCSRVIGRPLGCTCWTRGRPRV